jgi:glyceraldehyde 3-phosphate dehydrogenase
MPIKVAINGFGRIGRATFKILTNTPNPGCLISPVLANADVEVVAINDLTDPATLAYLLKYDSVYGRSDSQIEGKSSEDKSVGGIKFNGKVIPVFAEKDPVNLPWKKLEVDVVIESTGFFTNYTDSQKHITAGAKRVVISAPSKGEENDDNSIQVFGTEKTALVVESEKKPLIVSNASCTTNCVSPVMQVMESAFGVEKALMSTIHGYTSSQNLVDGPNKKIRLTRAAGLNIIPSSTGAAIATTKVISQLQEKFDGIAFRVPVPTGSVSDITFVTKKNVTVEEVNNAFVKAMEHPLWKNVLVASNESIVSTDVIGTYYSAIVDLEYTKVVGGNLVKVVAWYDNEWGYSSRLAEMAVILGSN